MCYLRKFQTVAAIQPSKSTIFDETDSCVSDDFSFIGIGDDFLFDTKKPQITLNKKNQSDLLHNLFSLLKYNSVIMDSLQSKIDQNYKSLNQLTFEENLQPTVNNQENLFQTQNSSTQENTQKIGYFSNQALTEKLFQKKNYEYKLNLTQNFPDVIYKERNISFDVLLTTQDGKVIRNLNIINLCLGVCNSNGEWISETKTGENFMKGKTQTQLYHGQGNFSKIYPRDVSRYYENGRVNFVIYPKPSMLHYSGNSSLESEVNYIEIEPLIIKDLTIRAKKKDSKSNI